ncbi:MULTISPECIES: hypothetical protein [unclassified Rathayibacter]|uniref:hypothetical protein n=1 Tax=unclassified Rathayibacter TaxID=2609250 RepID=UPI0011B0B4A2|nr:MULTISPECIES: hypothetical protein [unclassified Rathayibacter]
MDALGTSPGEELRRAARVAPDTLLRVARADWLAADVDTGRGVTTAHETVAAALGMCGKTVQRARALMESLGFAATVLDGRYLTRAERNAAHAAHGGRQLRMASTRALIMPRPTPATLPAPTSRTGESFGSVENVQLPRRRPLTSTAPVKRHSPTRGEPRSGAASRQPRRRSDAKRSSTGRPAVPRSIELQRFAAALAHRIPWLARGVHIGHVVGMLDRTGIDVSEWSVEGLMFAMNAWLSRDGRRVPETFTSRNALGFYGWVIRRVITEHSQLDTARRVAAAQRDADRARAAAERAAEAARLASIDQDEVDRIIAKMKADQREFERAARDREMARKRAAAEVREELAARAAELRSRG